jgi:hypothetical protein
MACKRSDPNPIPFPTNPKPERHARRTADRKTPKQVMYHARIPCQGRRAIVHNRPSRGIGGRCRRGHDPGGFRPTHYIIHDTMDGRIGESTSWEGVGKNRVAGCPVMGDIRDFFDGEARCARRTVGGTRCARADRYSSFFQSGRSRPRSSEGTCIPVSIEQGRNFSNSRNFRLLIRASPAHDVSVRFECPSVPSPRSVCRVYASFFRNFRPKDTGFA